MWVRVYSRVRADVMRAECRLRRQVAKVVGKLEGGFEQVGEGRSADLDLE